MNERLNREIRRRHRRRRDLPPIADQSSAWSVPSWPSKNDEWPDGPRYRGLEILSRSRLALITSTTNENQKEARTAGAISD